MEALNENNFPYRGYAWHAVRCARSAEHHQEIGFNDRAFLDYQMAIVRLLKQLIIWNGVAVSKSLMQSHRTLGLYECCYGAGSANGELRSLLLKLDKSYFETTYPTKYDIDDELEALYYGDAELVFAAKDLFYSLLKECVQLRDNRASAVQSKVQKLILE